MNISTWNRGPLCVCGSIYLLLVEFLFDFLFVAGIVDYRSGQLHLNVSQPGTQAAHFLFQLLNSHEGLPQLLHPDRRYIRFEQTFSRGETLLDPTHHLGTNLNLKTSQTFQTFATTINVAPKTSLTFNHITVLATINHPIIQLFNITSMR